MASDARVRYTKMVIREKFLALLKEKPLKRITVKEICELAEINRATFYKYYDDPYDLIEKIESDILREISDTLKFDLEASIHDTLKQILSKMKEGGDAYITLFSENGDRNFPMKIFRIGYSEISKRIDVQFPGLSQTEKAWMYIYAAQGSSGILNYWISDGMAEDIEDVASFIEKLISNTIAYQ